MLDPSGRPAPSRSAAALRYRQRHRQTIRRERQQRIRAQTPSVGEERRARYLAAVWANKTCAICGHPVIELHHSAYGLTPEYRYLTPWCHYHHADYSETVGPWLRRLGFEPVLATLFYTLHAERLHRIMPGPPRPGAGPRQLSIWGDQP
jgi:hypothetical protein